MAAREVVVPDIGDFADVPVIEILVKPGDRIAIDDPLMTLESDKATMDIPSPYDGVVAELKVAVGDAVSKGSPILLLGETGASADGPPQPAPEVASAPATESTPPGEEKLLPPPSAGTEDLVHAGPAVRAYARERKVDLTQVTGTGQKGRIRKEDVEAYLAGTAPARVGTAAAPAGAGLTVLAWPRIDFSKFGPTRSEPLSRIKRISGPNLHRNWVMIPHVTHNDEADITELEGFRKQNAETAKAQGVRLTMLAFLVKASVAALQRFPHFNASLDESGESLILKKYYSIGFAAETPNGLVVPMIREADRKGVLEIAKELGELSANARDGKLALADMQGGTFTISSLGGIGGTSFTPIVNAPEVAILGVTRHATKPTWDGSQFVPRLMLPLSLSYDHRVIDGADAARFTAHVATLLADMRRVLL